MIHTAELTYFPDRELIKEFKGLKDSVYYQQDNIWYNGSLKDHGLKFRLKIIETDNFTSMRFICRVNFSKLLHPDDSISLMTAWDIEAVENSFNDLVNDLLPQMPRFNEWYVNRIDYCVNIKTPYVEEYLNLLKKGDRRFMQDWYDRNGNYVQKPGSLYLVSTAKHKKNRGVTVNFYNKVDEMIKSHGIGDEDQEELPRDILRLEIQCHKVKTEHLRKKYGMPQKTVSYFLSPEIAYEMICTYLKRIEVTCDYSRKAVALEKVEQTNCRGSTKAKMKQLIQDVAKQHSSVSKVREMYANNGVMQRDEYNNLLRLMKEHGINPVTIRNNLHLDDRTLKQGLKNVFSLFEDAFEDEMIQEG